MLTPSRPPLIRVELSGVVRSVTVALAPVIRNTASTLPRRSVTAIVPRALRACASATARARTDSTSVTVRKLPAVAQEPSHVAGAAGALKGLAGGPLPLPQPGISIVTPIRQTPALNTISGDFISAP